MKHGITTKIKKGDDLEFLRLQFLFYVDYRKKKAKIYNFWEIPHLIVTIEPIEHKNCTVPY